MGSAGYWSIWADRLMIMHAGTGSEAGVSGGGGGIESQRGASADYRFAHAKVCTGALPNRDLTRTRPVQ